MPVPPVGSILINPSLSPKHDMLHPFSFDSTALVVISNEYVHEPSLSVAEAS